MNRRGFLALTPAIGLALAASAAPAETGIALATDLRADGKLSMARGAPIVILFSLPRCPYCEIVRRSHLAPMLRDPAQASRVIIRQLDIGGDQSVTDFAGRKTTHGAIARAHDVHAAPVVAFWDGTGRAIAEPLSGMLLPDFYSAYLDSAIESARSRLAARN